MLNGYKGTFEAAAEAAKNRLEELAINRAQAVRALAEVDQEIARCRQMIELVEGPPVKAPAPPAQPGLIQPTGNTAAVVLALAGMDHPVANEDVAKRTGLKSTSVNSALRHAERLGYAARVGYGRWHATEAGKQFNG